MKVIRAKILGFCMGVRRAVEMALRESSIGEKPGPESREHESGTRRHLYTLGPLIHNPRVMEDLKKLGVDILGEGDTPPEPSNSTVIIRAHGVAPETESGLRSQGVRILDATCPHVKQNQMKARSFAEKGYFIFLAGEKNHGEIIGIRAYAEAGFRLIAPDSSNGPDDSDRIGSVHNFIPGFFPCCVVGNPGEAEREGEALFNRYGRVKAVLIGQTTIGPGEYRAIKKKLRCYFSDLEVLDTICRATVERQEALRELSTQVEAFVIAGHGDSANARRLLSTALDTGKNAWLVENAAGIPEEVFGYSVVGLSAGASTPDETVDEIEQALRGKL